MRIKAAIVVIGEISCGKSTLALRLSSELGIPKASFGAYLLNYCQENNIPEDKRGYLQQLGQEMIDKDAPGFLHNVISFSGSDLSRLIFEGVRHDIILKEISAMSDRIATIYIDATYAQRLSRFLSREKQIDVHKTDADFITASRHPVESEVPLLKDRCSYVIQSSDSEEDDFQQLKSFVERWLAK